MNHHADPDTSLGQTKSPSALRELLAVYREKSKTEREKGTYFEMLIRDFLKHDPTYGPNFSDVWTYAEWATLQGIDTRDVGIDLVGDVSRNPRKFRQAITSIKCPTYSAPGFKSRMFQETGFPDFR